MTHLATTPPTPTEREAALAEGSPLFVRSDSQLVFREAIRMGRLSDNAKSPIFAGRFMYIGSTMGTHRDLFKHIDSKLYLPDKDTEQWARDRQLPVVYDQRVWCEGCCPVPYGLKTRLTEPADCHRCGLRHEVTP